MSKIEPEVLDFVFGPGQGGCERERAKSSTRQFVRSLDQIAEYSPKAKGRRLTAVEALDAYGFEVLREVACEGSALLSADPRSAGRLLFERRERLGLDIRHVANAAKVTKDLVQQAENGKRVPIREVEKIARVLGLDERLVSWKSEAPKNNEHIAVRLRTMGSEIPQLTQSAVSSIAEAAWVAETQLRLAEALGMSSDMHGIDTSPNYGAPGYPPYKHGYYLASDARQKLGLGDERLPKSLREIAEDLLGIPVIQTEIGGGIAGATVEIGDARAIIINLSGNNSNVLVRRATVAHELGHLLYDPPAKLDALRVDDYDQLDRMPSEQNDPVEQRANAFGIEFIAPQAAVANRYDSAKGKYGVFEVMNHFGISHTASCYQIWNAKDRRISLESLLSAPSKQPGSAWSAMENFRTDWHPVTGGIRRSRAGRFSAVVVRAAEEGLISHDTASELLEASEDQVRQATSEIKDLFPTVFS